VSAGTTAGGDRRQSATPSKEFSGLDNSGAGEVRPDAEKEPPDCLAGGYIKADSARQMGQKPRARRCNTDLREKDGEGLLVFFYTRQEPILAYPSRTYPYPVACLMAYQRILTASTISLAISSMVKSAVLRALPKVPAAS
jgi:hypothetical protein